MGSRMSAAIVNRLQATTNGDISWTAIRMNKYGTPQMIPKAQNAAHPRQLTQLSSKYRAAPYPSFSRVSQFLRRLRRDEAAPATAML
jgi:hypothetical protein